ncbi:MAG: aldehyde dehydrogenase family protein [Nitriliruptoraceae bacterium]|nr:aldehyde dehydrogenase family protein [Nitriliruptoraceae bacterium]
MDTEPLNELTPGMPIVVGGDRIVRVPDDLAARFVAGDALLSVDDGTLLHVPAADRAAARRAVDAAVAAFARMGEVDLEQLDTFYEAFAGALEDDERFAPIAAANEADVDAARQRGRSTTRLALDDRMRQGMIDGLRAWATIPAARGEVVDTRTHEGWRLEQVADRLGVVAFVFEGRPNVFADACGVLRNGNTVVFRIGSDALGTARAIVTHALDPALEVAGLPAGAASLVDAPSRASGWALFSDARLGLAVARGSGTAVHQLSAVAAQAGNDVSAHGTGGAWMLVADAADPDRLAATVQASLDRKVCNTLNTLVLPRGRVDELLPVALDAIDAAAAERGVPAKLHVRETDRVHVPAARFETVVAVARAQGPVDEPQAETLPEDELGTEWEWEDSPELTLVVVDDLEQGVALCNRYAPRFVVSVISEDRADHERVWEAVDAPFVGDGFTRWVDGQYALGTPELGLSNWERGRLFGRGAVLSGDVIRTVRTRMTQDDPSVRR